MMATAHKIAAIDAPGLTRIGNTEVFRQDCGPYILYYIPGQVAVVSQEDDSRFCGGMRAEEINAFWQQGYAALMTWEQRLRTPFDPACLTLYINNTCNLHCTYCYANPTSGTSQTLRLNAIVAAGNRVAEACSAGKRLFTVAFHGGGEPLQDQTLITQALDALSGIAEHYAVTPFWYIATNGVMSDDQAHWLASHFDAVGMSCDGPPDIQNAQRPATGGNATSPHVERTARILHRHGTTLHIRATITAQTLLRQTEIAEYLCQVLHPAEIHFEPVYQGGRMADSLQPDHAELYAKHFIEARQVCRSYGVTLATSGSRLQVIHGPYCNALRNVVNLVPGDVATNCFKLTRAEQVQAAAQMLGHYDEKAGTLVVDQRHIDAIRSSLATPPQVCAACFNRLHCTWGCPDICALENQSAAIIESFRCKVNKLLAYTQIRETADWLWSDLQREERTHHEAITYRIARL